MSCEGLGSSLKRPKAGVPPWGSLHGTAGVPALLGSGELLGRDSEKGGRASLSRPLPSTPSAPHPPGPHSPPRPAASPKSLTLPARSSSQRPNRDRSPRSGRRDHGSVSSGTSLGCLTSSVTPSPHSRSPLERVDLTWDSDGCTRSPVIRKGVCRGPRGAARMEGRTGAVVERGRAWTRPRGSAAAQARVCILWVLQLPRASDGGSLLRAGSSSNERPQKSGFWGPTLPEACDVPRSPDISRRECEF